MPCGAYAQMGRQNRIDRRPWFNERTNGSFLILGSKKNKCGAGLGTSEADAGESCKQIKRDNTKAANGRYWITGCVVVQESHAPFSPPLPPPTRYVCARVLLRAQREREREREREGGGLAKRTPARTPPRLKRCQRLVLAVRSPGGAVRSKPSRSKSSAGTRTALVAGGR